MRKTIILENQKVEYALRRSRRARRMRLAVYGDGSVVVTAPFKLDETLTERFIREKTRWLFSKILFFKQFPHPPVVRRSHSDYLKNKEKARELIQSRIDYFSGLHGFRYDKVFIKNQKTCWGSCSKRSNLNFNYKILFLPEKIQDYIIVHELCHLKEFNHSKKFWDLVAQLIPEYASFRAELKKNGLKYN